MAITVPLFLFWTCCTYPWIFHKTAFKQIFMRNGTFFLKVQAYKPYCPAKQTIQYKPSQKPQWFPLKYYNKPLTFSCKSITQFIFVVCFGHFSNTGFNIPSHTNIDTIIVSIKSNTIPIKTIKSITFSIVFWAWFYSFFFSRVTTL